MLLLPLCVFSFQSIKLSFILPKSVLSSHVAVSTQNSDPSLFLAINYSPVIFRKILLLFYATESFRKIFAINDLMT